MEDAKTKPNIFNYLDILFYLQDYYHWRKSLLSDFSYEIWADEIGFKSRSYVRMIVMGKRKIPGSFVDAYSDQCLESKEEKEYISYLVSYSQARSQRDKKAFSAKMLQIIRTKNNQSLLEDQEDIVSNPKLLHLFTILGFKDIQLSLENIAKIMHLSEEEVASYLNKLEDFNLIEKTAGAKTTWRARLEKFKISDNKGSVNLRKFHELSLHEALNSFDKPKHLRKYKSIMIPLTEEELAQLESNIESFTAEQISQFSPSEYKGRKLFQVNLNFYPVVNEIN